LIKENHEGLGSRTVVLETDCVVGKRTTTRRLWEACNRPWNKAEMIFTGQIDWMQSEHNYGFISDSTPNNF
jgi:uncharacterized NAD-dependent epimerase/dehydratase family protein